MKHKFAYISLIYVVIGLLTADLVLDQSSNKAYSIYYNSEENAFDNDINPDINEIIHKTITINPQATLNIDELSKLSNDIIGYGTTQEAKDYLIGLNAYCVGSSNSKKNYLTFDLGDDRGYVEEILNSLLEKDVKAVFFVTKPYIDRNPDLVRRMIDEGHIVGNHTVSHFDSTTISLEKLQSEIMDLHRQMLDEFDYQMYLFRFPYGACSDRTLAAVNELGYITMFWSFTYADYDPSVQPGDEYAYNIVVNNSHNGAIYLSHAVSKNESNALPEIIDTLRDQGFELALLDGEPE